jgi:hypothetical protein
MKTLIAYILFIIFTGSAVADLYKDIFNDDNISISKTDTQEGDEKKETEKEDGLSKDKIISYTDFNIIHLVAAQKYYLTHLLTLPEPYSSIYIIPPEVI